jgi:hypothetical protein
MCCSACGSKPPCETRKQMRERHGTPAEFEEALVKALGEISTREADEAYWKYLRDYTDATEG